MRSTNFPDSKWGLQEILVTAVGAKRLGRVSAKGEGVMEKVSREEELYQTWHNSAFNIERVSGKAPGTLILRLSGRFGLRNLGKGVSLDDLKKILELTPEPGEEPVTQNILDFTACPDIESFGLGMVMTHYVRCQRKGIKLVAAGLSPRLMKLFKMTKADTLFPIVTTAEEAEVC
jgi:anti-anti-sigma factor